MFDSYIRSLLLTFIPAHALSPLHCRPLRPRLQKSKAQGSIDDMDTAALLNSLASLYMDMDRPTDALPLYQRALAAVQV